MSATTQNTVIKTRETIRTWKAARCLQQRSKDPFGNGTLLVCYTCSKDLLHGTPDGSRFSPMADAKAKGDFVDSNMKTTATAGCLLDIPGSTLIMEFKACGHGPLDVQRLVIADPLKWSVDY